MNHDESRVRYYCRVYPVGYRWAWVRRLIDPADWRGMPGLSASARRIARFEIWAHPPDADHAFIIWPVPSFADDALRRTVNEFLWAKAQGARRKPVMSPAVLARARRRTRRQFSRFLDECAWCVGHVRPAGSIGRVLRYFRGAMERQQRQA